MRYPKTFAAVLLCASLAAGTMKAAHALINSNNLGASYDSQNTNITFRVYSSQATRIVLYLYPGGYGVQESATYVLSPASNNVWAVTVPVSAIQGAGITGTVYYGYRAWGPNWPYNASWAKGLRRALSQMSMPTATASIQISYCSTPTRWKSARTRSMRRINLASFSHPGQLTG